MERGRKIGAMIVLRMFGVTTLQHAHFGEPEWWIACGISVFLVIFAGLMSGLTLGLMSLGLVDLEVLQQSGTAEEKKQASEQLPTLIPRLGFMSCNQRTKHLSYFHTVNNQFLFWSSCLFRNVFNNKLRIWLMFRVSFGNRCQK